VKKLMAGRKTQPANAPVAEAARAAAGASGTPPAVPAAVPQFFAPAPEGATLRPMLAGAAQARFVDVKRKVDIARESMFLTPIGEGPIPVNWDDAVESEIDPMSLAPEPPAGASYEPLPSPASQAKNYAAWKREFTTWLAASQTVTLFRSPSTGLVSAPEEDEGAFRARARLAAREARDAAVEELRRKFAPKFATLEERLRRAQQVVEREQQQAEAEKYQSAISIGTTVLGALFGRRTISATTLGRAGGAARSMSRARKEAADVARSAETLEAVRHQLAELQADLDARISELQGALNPAGETLERIEIRPKKTHIAVRLVALVWAPV
jgi:hypothetical protein